MLDELLMGSVCSVTLHKIGVWMVYVRQIIPTSEPFLLLAMFLWLGKLIARSIYFCIVAFMWQPYFLRSHVVLLTLM